jgi:hypothetical protein
MNVAGSGVPDGVWPTIDSDRRLILYLSQAGLVAITHAKRRNSSCPWPHIYGPTYASDSLTLIAFTL